MREDPVILNCGKELILMNHAEFMEKAKELVANFTNENTISTISERVIEPEDVYVVWSVKALENSKALLSTPLFDGMYYEVTLNGSKNEIYFDAYKKVQNIKVEV